LDRAGTGGGGTRAERLGYQVRGRDPLAREELEGHGDDAVAGAEGPPGKLETTVSRALVRIGDLTGDPRGENAPPGVGGGVELRGRTSPRTP
jgi:hypothetical protein